MSLRVIDEFLQQLDLIKIQMSHVLCHRCGEWTQEVVGLMIDHIKRIERPEREHHLLNLVNLVYSEEKMDALSRHFMV